MSTGALLTPKSKNSDMPVSGALAIFLGLILLFFWIKSPKIVEAASEKFSLFLEINDAVLYVVAGAFLFNTIWLFTMVSKGLRLGRQGAHLKPSIFDGLFEIPDIKISVLLFFFSTAAGFGVSKTLLNLKHLNFLPLDISAIQSKWLLFSSINTTLALIGLGLLSLWILEGILRLAGIEFQTFNSLPKLAFIQDGIAIGSIHEDEHSLKNPKDNSKKKRLRAQWLYLGLKALTGNLFITGAIGSGKSQILLRILKEIISKFTITPALLAIDPKRTFVRELRNIIEHQGQASRLLWVSLEGAVKFNPIWREKMLKGSIFTEIANSLRLASINFLGSSNDNRFWEQSSFNLLKNALIFCAAKYEYFTFKELYQALVLARDTDVAAELVDYLNSKTWDEEERDNIQMAISYFKEEFCQMDQKIRTSILATATSFLNEFLEYRVSRILSPKINEISLYSMKGAIRDGKLICLYIENDALARSIGTLMKLLFQEAVLEMVDERRDDPKARYALLVMDEYQDVATSGGGAGLGDDRYLAKARESKSITIAATQSVSSLENWIRSDPATREILQNFRTRIFGTTTDPKTIRLFQEPHGTFDRERRSHSMSESTQGSRGFFALGHGSNGKSNVSESVSVHYAAEYPVTAREFARLPAFETYAQIFDGLHTRFEKLFMKPYFLKDLRTPHKKIMKTMLETAKIPSLLLLMYAFSGITPIAQAGILFPNACSVIKSSQSSNCMDIQMSVCMCPWPVPHPCARLSYYVPQTFIEIWPNPNTTFFSSHPAAVQLMILPGPKIPFGVDDEMGSFSFHAHAIAVPFAFEMFSPLSCGGARFDKPCFDIMSENLGSHWSTGHADLLQPQYLAWQLSPKACLLKGIGQGFAGGVTPSIGSDMGGCSLPIGALPKYPPTSREACNGWGMFLPRSGIYQGASRPTAALMIASRLKSIGAEVMRTVPSDSNEKWQMLSPQSSSCFQEGQNAGLLETVKEVREEKRVLGKPNGYLFVVWKKVSCCKEIPDAIATQVALLAFKLACMAVPSGV